MSDKQQSKATGLIDFHGHILVVLEHFEQLFIPARALTDMVGMQWKGARRSLLRGDSAKLYGTTELIEPVFAGIGTLKCPAKLLCIRLDRAHMYLARVNTDRMRANDNDSAADDLLALQNEWAEVLHRYESGETVSKAQLEDEKSLNNLLTARGKCKTKQEHAALDILIARKFAAMGAGRVGESGQLEMFSA